MAIHSYKTTNLPRLKNAHTYTREELASKDSSRLDCCFLLKHYIECSTELLCCVWVDHRNIAFNFEWSLRCHCAQIPESDTCRDIPLIGVLFVDGGVLGHEWGVPLTDYKISKSHFTVQFVCSEAWYEATAALRNAKHSVPNRSPVGLQRCTSKYALQGSLTHPHIIKLLTDSYLQENKLPLDNEDCHYIFPGLAFRDPPQLMSLYHFIFPGMLNPLSCSVEDIVCCAFQHALGARWRTCALDTNTANTANL